MAADRMGVIDDDLVMPGAQPVDLRLQRGMIGHEPVGPPPVDFGRIGDGAGIERFAVEIGRRAKFGCGLPRIERGAGGIAIDVDHAARNGCADRRCAQIASEGVKLIHPPVGIRARDPGRAERAADIGEIGAGVGKGDDQRRLAPPDVEPVVHPSTGRA